MKKFILFAFMFLALRAYSVTPCNIPDFKVTVYSSGVLFSFTPPAEAASWMPILQFDVAPAPNQPTIYPCGTNLWCYNCGATNTVPFVLSAYNMIAPGTKYKGVVQFYTKRDSITGVFSTICEQPFTFETLPVTTYQCQAATTVYGTYNNALLKENISWLAYAPSYSVLANGMVLANATAQEVNVDLAAGTYQVQVVSHCTDGDKTSGVYIITVPAPPCPAQPCKPRQHWDYTLCKCVKN